MSSNLSEDLRTDGSLSCVKWQPWAQRMAKRLGRLGVPSPMPDHHTVLEPDGECSSRRAAKRAKRSRRLSPGEMAPTAASTDEAHQQQQQKRSSLRQQTRTLAERRLMFAPASCLPGPNDLNAALLTLATVAENIAAAATRNGVNLASPSSHPGAVGKTWYMTTSYSGWGSAEMSMGQVLRHLAAAGVSVPTVVMHSATDYQVCCRQALQEHKSETAPQHVLLDVLDRMPTTLRQQLAALAESYRQSITECQANLVLTQGHKAAQKERKRLVQHLGDEYVKMVRAELEVLTFSRKQLCRCANHRGKRCPVAPPARQEDFWLEVAGTTCVAWSTMSTTSWGWLDVSGLPCLVWCYWVLGTEPDAVAHEIVAGAYQPQVMIDILSPKFGASSIISSPTFWGIPSHRTRRYTVFLHRRFKLHRHMHPPSDILSAATAIPMATVATSSAARPREQANHTDALLDILCSQPAIEMNISDSTAVELIGSICDGHHQHEVREEEPLPLP